LCKATLLIWSGVQASGDEVVAHGRLVAKGSSAKFDPPSQSILVQRFDYHSILLNTFRHLKQKAMASPPPGEDQARLLEDALGVVRQQTVLMRRCLETPGKLMDALKCRLVPDNQWNGAILKFPYVSLADDIAQQLDLGVRTTNKQPRS
jgi:hypothetical protein